MASTTIEVAKLPERLEKSRMIIIHSGDELNAQLIDYNRVLIKETDSLKSFIYKLRCEIDGCNAHSVTDDQLIEYIKAGVSGLRWMKK